MLAARRLEQAVLRLTIYNELPAFLNPALQQQAWAQPALAERLDQLRMQVNDGLDLLAKHWRRPTAASKPQP